MSNVPTQGDSLRQFALAAADLMLSTDPSGRILHAAGDAAMLFHPTPDRLIGRNAIELISDGQSQRLREELWALGPGRRLSWDEPGGMDGGRRILVQRSPSDADAFAILVSRLPKQTQFRGARGDDVLSDRFRDAVMNGRLQVALQPVVETATGIVSHYEMLARFEGEDSPSSLIVAAERTGQISHLDYVMVEAAAARLAADPNPCLRLAVNISGESLQRLDVIRELCAVIAGHSFRRDRLIIEVTESASIVEIAAASESVSLLRRCGLGVSLDDFGAGSASFGYLRELDVNGLKFDGCFLSSPDGDLRGLALMRSVARMCAELGIASVGERVETETQRRQLMEAGVRYAQGYLFGAPAIDRGFFARGRHLAASAA